MRKIADLAALSFFAPVLALGLIAAGPPPTVSNPGFAITGLGNAEAKACSDHARLVADGKMSPAFALESCTEALNIESLDRHDLAATHNNRGVLYLTMEGPADARADFEAAAKIEPKLGETWVNHGVAQVRMGQNAEALSDFDHGLALGTAEPWRAYFNRAIARENLGDTKGAYADYMKAQDLKPDWAPPKQELARFKVTGR